MRTLLALLLLLLLAAGGCDQHVELPGATVVADAPAPRPADATAQLAPSAPAPTVTTPAADPLANILIGQVTAIADGDTLTVLDATNSPHRIRLQGIDAPEGEQPFSAESEQALRDKLLGKTVRIEWREKDRYGRTLGHAYLDGRYINQEMIAEGWAWHYAYYWPDPEFAEAERDARVSGGAGAVADEDDGGAGCGCRSTRRAADSPLLDRLPPGDLLPIVRSACEQRSEQLICHIANEQPRFAIAHDDRQTSLHVPQRFARGGQVDRQVRGHRPRLRVRSAADDHNNCLARPVGQVPD